MSARPLSLALVLALSAPAFAQVRDARPFAGEVMETFASVSSGAHKQVLTAAGRFSSQQAHGVHLADSFTNAACGSVTPPTGGQVLAMDDELCYHPNHSEVRFADPIARFGASWLGSHGSTARFTLTFFDAAGTRIGARDAVIPGDCQWHWVGFELPPQRPAKRIHIFNHDSAQLVLDYATIDLAEVDSTPFCPPPSVNSTGEPASLIALGSREVARDELWLSASPVPDSVGVFFYGASQIQVPFGNGMRCVGGASGIARLAPTQASGGTLTSQVDLAASGIQPGSIWHFQALYRDTASGQPVTDLSSALTLTFE